MTCGCRKVNDSETVRIRAVSNNKMNSDAPDTNAVNVGNHENVNDKSNAFLAFGVQTVFTLATPDRPQGQKGLS